MSRVLPEVTTLRDAVRCVIESNTRDGYIPARFISITANGEASDIFNICKNLITKTALLEQLEKDIRKFPNMLTIEDFVAVHGGTWNFDDATINQAKARSTYFDQIAQMRRYN